MGDSTDDPDDGEILEAAITTMLAGMHTSMPARILSYTHGVRPRATVRPVVRFSFMDPDSEKRVTELPESVANVPILFPSSTDHSDTWPLAKGDPVYLLIAERSLDEWLATNANDNAPQDRRRFDLTDAVAIPALGAGALPADAIHASARVLRSTLLKLGSASASDFVALSSKVDSFISTFDTVMKAGWVVVPADGGAALKAAYALAFPIPPASTAATKVQAE